VTKTMMIKGAGAVLTAVLVCGTAAFAQVPQATPPPPAQAPAKPPVPEKPVIPLKVQVTLTRYQGETKTSNLPFTLWVNANRGMTDLHVGLQVPVSNGKDGFQYRNIGTVMSCKASSVDDGRFELDLTIDDSSVAPNKDSGGPTTYQDLSTHNTLLLRDGQVAQFVAATDKVTGEVTKIDVTVTVLK
jgi:hypothetical protein